MPSLATTRKRRERIDKAVAKAFTPPIARVIRREEARIKAATTETQMVNAVRVSEWVKVMVILWTSDPLTEVWDRQQKALGTSVPMPKSVQKQLRGIAEDHGRSIAATRKDRIKNRTAKSAVSANVVNDSNDDISSANVGDESDAFNDHKLSAMSANVGDVPIQPKSSEDAIPRSGIWEQHSGTNVAVKISPDPLRAGRTFRSTQRAVLSDLYTGVVDQAGATAFTEALQATETVRYESARTSADTASFRLKKVWFTQGDNKVRSSHAAVNGQSRFMRTPQGRKRRSVFRVGGASLEHPRQPGGDPGQVINCRCFLEYRKVRTRRRAA